MINKYTKFELYSLTRARDAKEGPNVTKIGRPPPNLCHRVRQ